MSELTVRANVIVHKTEDIGKANSSEGMTIVLRIIDYRINKGKSHKTRQQTMPERPASRFIICSCS